MTIMVSFDGRFCREKIARNPVRVRYRYQKKWFFVTVPYRRGHKMVQLHSEQVEYEVVHVLVNIGSHVCVQH